MNFNDRGLSFKRYSLLSFAAMVRIGFWYQTSKICAIVVINGSYMTQGSLTVAGHKFCDPCLTSDPCDHIETRLNDSKAPIDYFTPSSLTLHKALALPLSFHGLDSKMCSFRSNNNT